MPVQQIPNLIQGVSQQAAQQRRDTQCEEQFDCINSVTYGCAARPPAEVLKVWPGRDWSDAFMEEFTRGDENYLVGVAAEAPFAVNLDDGTDATITGSEYPNTTGYLDDVVGVSPKDQFRVQAVEDNIFFLNRHVAPAMDASVETDPQAYEALVWAQARQDSGASDVNLSGPGTVAATTSDNNSRSIISNLAADINALTGTQGYTAETNGSTMRVYRADAQDFTIETSDGQGDTIIKAYKGYIDGIEKLPPRGFDGMLFRVQGESRSVEDDFWVQWQGPSSTGAWVEVPGPELLTTIDPDTMPHTLVWTGTNTFEWEKKSWSTRIAGDAETAPDPSFIGKFCSDLFYHKNRLGILHEAGAVWSKARNPFTFFPDTVQTKLASAPVDVLMAAAQATGRGSVVLDYPVQIDKTLNFWGQGIQFEITNGQDNFKQESVSADPVTAYEYAPKSRPAVLGKFLYFPAEAGPWGVLYAVQYTQGKASPEIDVSAQINRYLPSGIRRVSGSTVLGMVLVLSEGEPENLYLWNFLYGDNQFLQSAWNTWRIPGGDILWASVKSNYLRVLQQRPEGLALLRFNLTPKWADDITGATYPTRLDMRVDQSQVTSLSYDSGTGRTTFTLPYEPTGPDLKVVIAETSGSLYRGKSMPVVSVTDDVVVVEGDLSGGVKFYAGQIITAERTESEFYVRTEKGATPFDRLNVNQFGIFLNDTGYTRLEASYGGEVYSTRDYRGRTVGLPGSLIGPPMLGKGSVVLPVDRQSKEVSIKMVNDSFLPSYWQSGFYDWSGVGLQGEK